MRIVVTGAFGFVGSAVVARLHGDGHEVVAVTSRSDQADHPTARVTLHADLRDRDAVLRVAGVLERADAVCHLAALTRVRESFERPIDYWQTNVGGTANLLSVLAATGRTVPFVHASTAVVYGTPDVQPIGEESPIVAPPSPYGASKLAADLAIRDAALAGLVGGVSLRGFNICGAVGGHGDPDLTRIIPKAVAVAAGQFEEVTVNGDGTAVRDFVHVADVADAFALAVAHARPGRFDVFNLGATSATVAEIVEVARKVTGHPIPTRSNPPAPEAPELRADTTRARAELGWEPRCSGLVEVIGDAWDAVRGQRG